MTWLLQRKAALQPGQLEGGKQGGLDEGLAGMRRDRLSPSRDGKLAPRQLTDPLILNRPTQDKASYVPPKPRELLKAVY